ncbi:MAG: GH32 C-terminal domain-containing protein, partial [Anaerolineae bacterium]|nr:GH32 C-terminal domain-containing protein [Anaerolineae bacterium]
RLCILPVRELQALRRGHWRLGEIAFNEGSYPLEVQSDSLELVAQIDPGNAQEVGLSLRRSPDGEEETLVLWQRKEGKLVIDRRRSSRDPAAYRDALMAPLALEEGLLELHIWLDRSVLEIFANRFLALTSRIYPTREDSLGLALVARGGSGRLLALDVWEMASIWPPE